MTEIREYRGKRVDTGEWATGTPIKSNTGKTYIITYLDDANGTPERVLWVEVDPSTVGQFTGLTDKNGTKIFEGDKLSRVNQYNNNEIEIFIIEWNEQAGGFYLNYIFYDEIYSLEEFWPDSEVIGNIYDNPELLEVEE